MWSGVSEHAQHAIIAGLVAFAATLGLTPIVRSTAVRFGWITRPAEDRWGRRVVARLGGVAMFSGVAVALLPWAAREPEIRGLLLGMTLVFGLGLADDIHRMPPYTKLIAQLIISCLVVFTGVRLTVLPWLPWAWLSVPLSVIWIVFVMNAFNLLDNMDGLAAGVGMIAALCGAAHAAVLGQWTIAAIAAILAGACRGFLYYNFPPAKIFMGDSGSHLIGMGLAALPLMGGTHSTHLVSVLAIPTLLLAVPIFDTCFVTTQRLLNRLHPFVGGTDHVSHRLAILGLSTRQTVVALYGVSLCLGLLSLASMRMTPLPTLALWASVVTALIVCGLYLGQVKVYRGPAFGPLPASGSRATPIGTMLLHKRRLLEILIDFCILSSACVFAYLLRFEGTLTSEHQLRLMQSLPIILVVNLATFAGCGLYQGVWRYMSLLDLVAVFKAVTLGSVLSAISLLYLWRFEGFSRAVLIITWMLTFLGVGGSRVLERLLDEWIRGAIGRGAPAVIVGAGDTGAQVLRSLQYGAKGAYQIIGFLDDDLRKLGSRICGAPVVGTRADLPKLIEDARIKEVLVAITDPPGDLLQFIRSCCEPRGVTWKVVTAGVTDAAA